MGDIVHSDKEKEEKRVNKSEKELGRKDIGWAKHLEKVLQENNYNDLEAT